MRFRARNREHAASDNFVAATISFSGNSSSSGSTSRRQGTASRFARPYSLRASWLGWALQLRLHDGIATDRPRGSI
ncbi:MAG: hypothetical protein WBW87_04180, partial [Candidatus Cybelea sp.]